MPLLLDLPETRALRTLTPNGRLLFATRVVRMFAYGLVSVVLVLYLAQLGLSDPQIGVLLTLTMLGDAGVSLWMAVTADRIGRRKMLLIGSGLMLVACAGFTLTDSLLLLTLAAIFGTLSPSGNEVGPCQSIEQAVLPQATIDEHRTQLFAWYNLAGYLATATGALVSGFTAHTMQSSGYPAVESYRMIIFGYGLLGGVLALLFSRLSPSIEVNVDRPRSVGSHPFTGWIGIHQSRGIVIKLAGLYMVDAIGGGLVLQSLIAYWFYLRFGADPATLGAIFFGANMLSGWSALGAARIARRIGLLNTMVFTHIPSNVLLMLVPLMPTLPLAVGILLARHTVSQMDIPTRQSYLAAVVAPEERSAASGVTNIARTLGAAWSPMATAALLGASIFSLPFLLAGGLKIVYDLSMLYTFRGIKPPEEMARSAKL